ncbi:MAG: aldehyde ferredoxin oxidoreductase family protein [Atribacterota bacterium]|nr:aldehyde ferredoxin oxidoreductase family protein [Atribacterota bacterium]
MNYFQRKNIRINLSNNEIRAESFSDDLYSDFLGGSGIASYILYTEQAYSLSPFSPQMPLLIIPGLLTGTPVPSACKTSICSKSPLSNSWSESTVGGYFGAELKKAGYDGIYITGKADKPVYIMIDNDKVEIRSAERIWGKDNSTASKRLKEEAGNQAVFMCIGIAGENLVKISGISVFTEYNEMRVAARGGLGAVMGAKKLKAIVVRGTKRVDLENKDALIRSIKGYIPSIKEATRAFSHYGTSGSVPGAEMSGDLPIMNWRGTSWEEKSLKISQQTMAEKAFVKHHSCFACPIRCAKTVKILSGPYEGEETEQPEYETIAGLGSMLLNDDLATLIEAADLCNRYGLDTMSAGSVIAFAMEAYENGLITEKDTGGIKVEWGNRDAILKLITKITNKDAIGAILSEGTKNAASHIGGIAREFAMHVKGFEVAFHDPRLWATMALNYATANRGACHLESLSYIAESGRFNPSLIGFGPTRSWEENVALVIKMQNFMTVLNALGICKFIILGGIGPEQITQWLNLVTNWELDVEGLLFLGNKLFNLKRAFNNKIGFTRMDDTLPPRLLKSARVKGGYAEKNPQLDRMLERYYQIREWDEFGRVEINLE